MREYAVLTDDVLVEKTLSGDDRAYSELVIRHEQAVKRAALRITGNHFSAEDASQDAFVSAWAHLDSLKDREKFGIWVLSIAKNRAKSILRSYSAAAAQISLDNIGNLELYDSTDIDIPQIVSQKEDALELHRAVDALSEKISEAIRLHYFEGLAVEQISERLKVPAGTVKWRLCEGRKQLRKGYGVMENTYNESEALVKRVMRQVEELKLWRLKNNREGFEEAYRGVLAAVEGLGESKQRSHALADVLQLGYWWLESEKTEAIRNKMEKAAIEGRNEDVYTSILSMETNGLSGQAKIDYMKHTQLPRLEKQGFVKAASYLRFWMGYEYLAMEDYAAAIDCFKGCLEISLPSNSYYAAALAAVSGLERRLGAKSDSDLRILGMSVGGECWKLIGGKLYLWNRPSFSDDMLYWNYGSVFSQMSFCDGLICDPELHFPDKITSSDGKYTVSCIEEGARVLTPAGLFEDCRVYELSREPNGEQSAKSYRCVTWFCPDVGVVRQRVEADLSSFEWELVRYSIVGGSGLMPLAVGNRWEYSTPDGKDGLISDTAAIYEVRYSDGSTAVSSSELRLYCEFDLSSCIGNLARAGYEFEAGENVKELPDVLGYIARAGEMVKGDTERQLFEKFAAVHKRILASEISYSPNCAYVGRQNGFEVYSAVSSDGETRLDRTLPYCYLFQYLMTYQTGDAFKSWYNTLLWTIARAWGGVVWSDEWVPGYHSKRMKVYYGDDKGKLYPVELSVLEDESVLTPAGYFESCRHIRLENMAEIADKKCYLGVFDLWYAEGVGLVKLSRPLWRFVENIWQLTEYKGRGKGYFPIEPGLFRRYEPKDLAGGWRANVEYSYLENGAQTLIAADMTAEQERGIFEKEEAARRKREG